MSEGTWAFTGEQLYCDDVPIVMDWGDIVLELNRLESEKAKLLAAAKELITLFAGHSEIGIVGYYRCDTCGEALDRYVHELDIDGRPMDYEGECCHGAGDEGESCDGHYGPAQCTAHIELSRLVSIETAINEVEAE